MQALSKPKSRPIFQAMIQNSDSHSTETAMVVPVVDLWYASGSALRPGNLGPSFMVVLFILLGSVPVNLASSVKSLRKLLRQVEKSLKSKRKEVQLP